MSLGLMVAISVRLAVELLVLVGLCSPGAPAPRRADTAEDLQARIQKEQNPVKRAKYEIRLGRLRLLTAIEAYDKGDAERFGQLLGEYVDQMKKAWQSLLASGRRAARQPQGFKELDISLREEARILEDLKHRVPYNDREPVEKAFQEVEELRSQVLRALFPSDRPAKDENKFLGSRGGGPMSGRIPQ